jgi:hypothetical protein
MKSRRAIPPIKSSSAGIMRHRDRTAPARYAKYAEIAGHAAKAASIFSGGLGRRLLVSQPAKIVFDANVRDWDQLDYLSGITISRSLVSTTKTARSFAGAVVLAFWLIW